MGLNYLLGSVRDTRSKKMKNSFCAQEVKVTGSNIILKQQWAAII